MVRREARCGIVMWEITEGTTCAPHIGAGAASGPEARRPRHAVRHLALLVQPRKQRVSRASSEHRHVITTVRRCCQVKICMRPPTQFTCNRNNVRRLRFCPGSNIYKQDTILCILTIVDVLRYILPFATDV